MMTFTERDVARLCSVLEQEAGLAVGGDRQGVLQAGVTSRMSARHLTSVADYHQLLISPDGRTEVQALLELLTVGETQFFRYRAQFDLLIQHVLPALVRQRAAVDRRLTVWSAGCATGEEAYSIAMALRHTLPEPKTWAVSLLATDINRQYLQHAREARYAARALRDVPAEWQRQDVRPDGDGYVLQDEVRRLVRLLPHNLVRDPWTAPGMQGVDVLFCRNVTIYLTAAATRRIVEQLAASLQAGGYLFLGHAETLSGVSTVLEPVVFPEAVVYHKPLASLLPPSEPVGDPHAAAQRLRQALLGLR